MLATQDWKCERCKTSGSIIILGKTQVQIIYDIAEQHNFNSPDCGTIAMILLIAEKRKENMCKCNTFDLTAHHKTTNAYLTSDGFIHTKVKCPDEKFYDKDEISQQEKLKEQFEFAERHTE